MPVNGSVSLHPSVMNFLPRFGNGFGEHQAVKGSPRCCRRWGSAPEGWDVLGSCCLQLFPFSSGCFGSKKQLLGAPGAELAVVGTEGGRLGACKAVGSSGHPLPGALSPKASREGALGGPKPRGWQQGWTLMVPACSPGTKLCLDPCMHQKAPARLATAVLRLGRPVAGSPVARG